tara:strand:+ start:4958 stop:5191 length:234 start_codon:yes stop_codon:yes gene_type:complete
MSADYLLPDLLLQETELQFELFNNQTAWQLGCKLKKIAEDKNALVAIEVYAFNQTLFSYAMSSTQLDNQRKRSIIPI